MPGPKAAAPKTTKNAPLTSVVQPTAEIDKPTRFTLERAFKHVQRPPLADFSAVEDGDSEIWIVQLPRQVPLQRLAGKVLHLDSLSDEGVGRLGSLKDEAAGTSYVLSQEAGSLAQQVAVLAPDGTGWANRMPVARRVTLSYDLRSLGAARGDDPDDPSTAPPEVLYSDQLMAGQPEDRPNALKPQVAVPKAAAAASAPAVEDQEPSEKKKKKKRKSEAAGSVPAPAMVDAVPAQLPPSESPAAEQRKPKKHKKKHKAADGEDE